MTVGAVQALTLLRLAAELQLLDTALVKDLAARARVLALTAGCAERRYRALPWAHGALGYVNAR